MVQLSVMHHVCLPYELFSITQLWVSVMSDLHADPDACNIAERSQVNKKTLRARI